MCGRYYIPEPDDDSGFKEILEHIKKVYGEAAVLSEAKHGEIYPTNIVPVMTEKEPVLMKWGFPRFDGKGQVINARLETADEKPMFKKAFYASRCLIPAGYYFEWRKDGLHKTKYAIGRDNIIYMAGIYRHAAPSALPLFVILTRPAAPGIAFIHDRMPVILPENIHRKWLAELLDPQEVLAASDENMSYEAAY